MIMIKRLYSSDKKINGNLSQDIGYAHTLHNNFISRICSLFSFSLEPYAI